MIELLTGSPGAGKTTYAVAARLAVEVKRQITLDDDTCIRLGLERGTVVTRRIVVAGIRGLNIEHERLPHLLTKDPSPAAVVAEFNRTEDDTESPVHKRLPDEPAKAVPALMQNWWLWCKPGDLIVIDEAQFVMPRGTLGRKPPFWLQAMEIHRHYGVDFLLITQHPQLIDTTVRALVGLHRHIRSVMGSPMCMVYTWDHAANPERYHLANKSMFRRRRAHYKLFHSAAAHIAPPKAGRSIFLVVPLLLGAVGYGYAHIRDRLATKPAAVTPAASPASAARAAPPTLARAGAWRDVPPVRGCYSLGPTHCECFGDRGAPVRIALAMCQKSAAGFDGLIQWEPSTARRQDAPSPFQAPPAASSPAPVALFGSK